MALLWEALVTDLPFTTVATGMVILKQRPVLEYRGCAEHLIEDAVFARVERLSAVADHGAEIEVRRDAA